MQLIESYLYCWRSGYTINTWSVLGTHLFHVRFRDYSPSLLRHLCLSFVYICNCSAISWHFLFRPDGIKTLIYNKNYSVSPSYTTHTYRFFSNKKTLKWVIFNFSFWKKETFIFRVTRFNPNLCGNLSSILGEKGTYIQVKSGNSENKSSSGNSKWPESMWHSLLYIRRESHIYSGQILKKDLQK